MRVPFGFDENGNAVALWVKPQIIGRMDEWGRARPSDSSKPEVRVACDIVIVAIGQGIESRHFEEAGMPVKRGNITAMDDGEIINIPGVFAIGDVRTKALRQVVTAVADGATASHYIEEYLAHQI